MTVYNDGVFYLKWLIILVIFQQVSGIKLGWKRLSFIPLIYALIGYFCYDIEVYLEPFYLLITFFIYKLKNVWNWNQYIFNGLFPIVVSDLFTRIAGLYLRFVLNISLEEWWTYKWANFIVVILLIPLYTGFLKLIRVNIQSITQSYKNYSMNFGVTIFNISLLVYTILIFSFRYLEVASDSGMCRLNIDIRYGMDNVVYLYSLFFVGFLLYLNYRTHEWQNTQLQEIKDKQISYLSEYSHHIESLYQEIRSFRHDYTNILVSLNESIKSRNIDSVEEVYHSVLENTDKKFYQSKYDIAKLSNIQGDAMKSIVSAKLLKANSMGVAISVEIPEVIGVPNIEILDFITILSIFLDNAIEASVLSKNPSLTVAYFEDGAQKILVIENSIETFRVNTKTIFKRGFSSKGDNRGIGLANVKEILDKYDNVILNTTSVDYRFRQEMKFESEPYDM